MNQVLFNNAPGNRNRLNYALPNTLLLSKALGSQILPKKTNTTLVNPKPSIDMTLANPTSLTLTTLVNPTHLGSNQAPRTPDLT